ncbi:hypothetical protein ACFL4T_12760 [candidate division KSB1 bacterium]
MKKTAVFILSLLLVFAFCKKSSTNNEPEEEISKVKIILQDAETGDLMQGYPIEVSARVKHIVSWSGEDNPFAERMFIETETETQVTNQYGYVLFVYEDKLIPDDEAIFITHITIWDRQNNTLYDEDMEVSVANLETKEIIIEL